jgi:uncharacterized protein YbgA (DUF1722 family)
MAHSPQACHALGRLVGALRRTPRAELRARYARGFMQALALRASRGRNARVLRRMAGHLRDGLDAAARAELAGAIAEYRRGLVPLAVPMALVRHHARRQATAYLLGQAYLEPHPPELLLRDHV